MYYSEQNESINHAVFLEMNGISLQCTDDEPVDIGLSVASGRMKYEGLVPENPGPHSIIRGNYQSGCF